jgi:hypothetical protein
VILYPWDAPGPARTARGVTSGEAHARQAAEIFLTGGYATDAVVEKAILGLGAGSMTYGYQRTGPAWHALPTDGRVTWTCSAELRTRRKGPDRSDD